MHYDCGWQRRTGSDRAPDAFNLRDPLRIRGIVVQLVLVDLRDGDELLMEARQQLADPEHGLQVVQCRAVVLLVRSLGIYSYGFNNFAGFPNTLDVGLVILDAPVQTVYPDIDTYASLAAAGTLDAYGTGPDATVTVSGYGLTYTNPNKTISYRSRLMAETFIINLTSHNTAGFNVQLATNPGGDRGGTCFGDSGGPVLLDDTNVITAVNSYVLGQRLTTCKATAFAYRTDQQAVIDWILAHAGTEASEISIVTL